MKLTGRVTPVEISVDGVPMRFLAVAEQIDHPFAHCVYAADSIRVPNGGVIDTSRSGVDTLIVPYPPCQQSEEEYYSVRSLIAWQPDSMQRIVRITADTGRSRAPDAVPDVLAGMPTEVRPGSPDTSGGSVGGGVVRPVFYPGFFGEYFELPDGWWQATQGTEANSLIALNGNCTSDTLVLEWAKFTCQRARIAFEVSMTVEPGAFCGFGEIGTTSPRSQHTHKVEMRSHELEGVRLRLVDFEPPPVPPDSQFFYLPSSLEATVANGTVALRFVVFGDSSRDVTIGFSSGQSYDFEIYASDSSLTPPDSSVTSSDGSLTRYDGSLVWRWSDGKAFTAALREETLGRGNTLTYSEQWKPTTAKPGRYIAVARLASYNVISASRVVFKLP